MFVYRAIVFVYRAIVFVYRVVVFVYKVILFVYCICCDVLGISLMDCLNTWCYIHTF